MDLNLLASYGYNDRFASEAALYPDLHPARILSLEKGRCRVLCATGELTAEIAGRLRHEAQSDLNYPAVGDFVLLDRTDCGGGNAIVHHILPRKSLFVRHAPGASAQAPKPQIVAANIDRVFICMALTRDFNLRRLERALAIAWNSGALPVVVLTKADLSDSVDSQLSAAQGAAAGAEVVVTSSLDGQGFEQVQAKIGPGVTAAFIGSSGVGKSTLINRLIGEEAIETGAVRADGKGRHTTTRRELFLLQNGGLVIDTPGMRELGIETADVSRTFEDIEALAAACRFGDCVHVSEPGCAVQEALRAGTLDAARLESYRKLKKEARYEGLSSRGIETAKIQEMFSEAGGMKNARKFIKEKNKRR